MTGLEQRAREYTAKIFNGATPSEVVKAYIAGAREETRELKRELEEERFVTADLKKQIERMKNWCNCKNYQKCLIELAEQGKGMKPSECCVNCKKWELEDYRTRLERRKRR